MRVGEDGATVDVTVLRRPATNVFELSAARPAGLMSWDDADALHRSHCAMCAAESGVEPFGADHFVDELYARYWPPRLKSLLSGTGEHRPTGVTGDDGAK